MGWRGTSEALQLDEVRVALATARTVPEGLALIDGGSNGKTPLIDDVKKLDDRAIAIARTAGELLDTALAQGNFPLAHP